MPRSLTALILLVLTIASRAGLAASWPEPAEGDYAITNFHFASAETLPELRIHYRTLGSIHRNAQGHVDNAVLIMHGTGGAGTQFLNERFAGELFGPGQPLDATRYFIVLRDGIGHGKSSKPSDGLHMKFPRYNYDDMVQADYALLTEKLGVDHLRLVMGTSMGGMHSWVWGEMHPQFMDTLMPLASLPVQIAGRNRMMRKMFMDSIRNDPEWKQGDYSTQPVRGLANAQHFLLLMTSVPLQWQKDLPTRAMADSALQARTARSLATADANDMLYQFQSSREYNPAPHLEKISAPLFAINSADDQVNPPELGLMEREIVKVKQGRYILIPISDRTRGHGTHSLPAVWGEYLRGLLEKTK